MNLLDETRLLKTSENWLWPIQTDSLSANEMKKGTVGPLVRFIARPRLLQHDPVNQRADDRQARDHNHDHADQPPAVKLFRLIFWYIGHGRCGRSQSV